MVGGGEISWILVKGSQVEGDVKALNLHKNAFVRTRKMVQKLFSVWIWVGEGLFPECG